MKQEVKMFYYNNSSTDKELDVQITEYLKEHPTYTLFDLYMNQEFTMAIAVFNINKQIIS